MEYDLAIIGGGPAGLMAACRASELGAKVIVLEKNLRPGKKLLMTGGGRCNLTNNILDPKILASRYYPNGRFLISAFSRFGAWDTIDFFENKGIKTKIEANGRVFPISDKSSDIVSALIEEIKNNGVELKTGVSVKNIFIINKEIVKLKLDNGEVIRAKNYILSTGGKSYPATGSTGDAYSWLKKIGHKIINPRPALTSIRIKENFIKNLEGLSLNDVSLKLINDKKIISCERGDIIFTSNGLSGPAALNISRYIELNNINNIKLELDLYPDKNVIELEKYLQEAFHSGHKLFKNILEKITKPKLANVITFLLEIAPDRQANSITRVEKNKLINLLKKFMFSISGLGNFDEAMVTAGGVDLNEVDPKTMQSKLFSNLYFAGEILDLIGPTGGFNLQLCWSTGYVAGGSAVDKNIHS